MDHPRIADEAECQAVLTRFYAYLDERKYTELAALMARGGEWHRQGKVLNSPAMIVAELQKRLPTRSIAHLITNMVVDFPAADRAALRAYQTVFAFDDGAMRSGPAPLGPPNSIARVHVDLVREDGAWRIALAKSESLFKA